MISLTDVCKHFGERAAVQSLDLEVPRGAVFGLLGHNGAGKSTVIGILLGQVLPEKGRVHIADHDVFADRPHALARVGAIFEEPAFYDYLSGAQNLRILCEYTAPLEPEQMRKVVQLVRLEDRINDRVATYSHGMRRRLALAQALLPGPEVLILDEPTDGLDPEGIVATWDLIRKLHRERGLTILISSHQLGEMERVCTHLAVLREGRLLFAGDWRQRAMGHGVVDIRVDRQLEAERGLQEVGLVVEWDHQGRARLADGINLAAAAQWLVTKGFLIERLAPVEHSLEEFYLDITRNAPPPSPHGTEQPNNAEQNKLSGFPLISLSRPRSFGIALFAELLKLFARKRTYIGFGAFLTMEVVILAMLALPQSQQAFGVLMADNGLRFEDGYTGLTLAFFIIRFTVILLCGLYLALVAGDLVAKEVEEGTMRMVLARPVSRLRVFCLKAVAGGIHTMILMAFIGATSLLAGMLFRRGLGNLVAFAPKHEVFSVFAPKEGLWRYWRAILFMGLAYQVVSALGLMFSCFKMRPAAAATLTLSVVFVDFALRNIPTFYPYDEYFLTHHLACWVRTFQDVVPWSGITESLLLLTGLTATFWIVGAAYFCARDFKS